MGIGVVSVKRRVIALSCLVAIAGLLSTVIGRIARPERIYTVDEVRKPPK